jgi:DNA-binding MarR family transcriptional regulator
MHTTANVLGALGLALADRLSAAAALAGGVSAAEAIVALHGPGAGSSIDVVARIIGLSHSGTVRLVDRLARDGLLERRRGADQRSAALYLTPSGRRLARRVRTRRDAEMHSVLALLTDDQEETLELVARRILGGLGAEPGAEPRLCRLCDQEACGRSRGRCPVAGDPMSEPRFSSS